MALYHENIEIQERTLGHEHPGTLTSASNTQPPATPLRTNAIGGGGAESARLEHRGVCPLVGYF